MAFIAEVMNADGFLAVGQYTSPMTGIVSSMADATALGESWVVLAGFVSVLAFLAEAATTALLINWAKRRSLRSRYALSLLMEAALLLLFGQAGAYLAEDRDFLAPATVLLLCYIMGLQNAIFTKISGAVIRTTHVTGLSTDIGIELGKLFYFNRKSTPQPAVLVNRDKLKLHTALLCSFCVGGIIGAVGFKRIGFLATVAVTDGASDSTYSG